MGMASLFHKADFGGISPELRLGAIDQVIHKTFIEVDEKGTKAAAVTGVMVRSLAMRVNPPDFVADRPFAFLIIHNPTKTILFEGVVNDPKM
jgi:serine protease inhibitor